MTKTKTNHDFIRKYIKLNFKYENANFLLKKILWFTRSVRKCKDMIERGTSSFCLGWIDNYEDKI